ncbi:tetratricopeptide repeat protein, partial [Actinoplanes sp. NPDC026670]|uniref:tetratricopeptide repeat protein n=1 Tax=Actinoplanes sp. NPDC026670 TaxID=3154700 RepID=UPI0033FC90AD
MPSYSQQFDYRCAGCGHRGRHEVWLAVDIRERPDLARLIASGAATTQRCAECRSPVTVGARPSLLIRRPGMRPPLLFATTAEVTQDMLIRHFQMALMMLRRHEPPESHHQQDVQILPYDLLPLVVERDIETDADALAAGTFQAFTADMQHYRAWLADLVEERRGRRLLAAVRALLEAPGAAAWREVVLAHPELLDDDADLLLQHVVEQAAEDGEPQMAEQARHCLVRLRKCREFGIDRVLPATPPPAAPEQKPAEGRSLPPAVGTAVLMMLGREPLHEGRPVSPEARRNLLIEALLDFRDEDADLAVEWQSRMFVPIRDLLTFGLATDLVSRPESRLDLVEAVRRYAELDRLREVAPRFWADAQHNTALAHTLLADARDLGELDAARAAFDRALTVRTRTTDPDDWATTLAALAVLLFRDYPGTDLGRADEAVTMLAAAVADPPPGLGARPLLNLRVTHATALLSRSHRGDEAALTSAVTELERLWTEVSDLDDPEMKSVVATNYGHALTHIAERTGRPEDRRRLLDLARSARDQAAALGDDRLWVQTSGNLSQELFHGREWAEAESVLRAAIFRAGRAGMRREWANLHGHLARVLLERTDGDHDEHVGVALDLLTRARRDVDREADPENWAWLTGMLARAYRGIAGRRETQIELLRSAIEAVPRAVNPMRWAEGVRTVAGLLPPAEAVTRFAEAAEVLTRERYPHDWAALQHNASLAHRELAAETGDTGHLVRAVACMRDALAVRPPDQAPIEWAQTTRLLAETLHRHDGREAAVAEAERMLTEALPLLRDGGRAQDVLWTAQELGEVLVTRGRWAEAVAPLREALDVRDRIYDSGLLRHSREASLARSAGLPVRAAYVMVRAGDPAAAVDTLEAGRVRLLGDAMDRDPAGLAAAGARAPEAYAAYQAA